MKSKILRHRLNDQEYIKSLEDYIVELESELMHEQNKFNKLKFSQEIIDNTVVATISAT